MLVQLGEFDGLLPGASSVSVPPLPGVGHDFYTHFRNQEGWKLMDEWLSSEGF